MKTLLVLFFILTVMYLSFGDWQHPHYSYRCLENEKLELFGVHPSSTIKIDGEKKDDPACHVTQDKLSVVSIQYECLSRSESGTPYSAIVIVHDIEFDSRSQRKRRSDIPTPATTATTNSTLRTSSNKKTNTTTPATTTAPSYAGGRGQHKFLITCKDIPDEGINKTVAHVFQEKDYNSLPNNYKEVSDVEMRFKAVNNPAAPDINTIYIGDEFYMFIKYMGEQNYTVIPEECTAFGETWISKSRPKTGDNVVELWNIDKYRTQKSKDDCAEHKELLEEFGRHNETLIYAKMYGFRFAKKDYVTITCEVKIFNQDSIHVDDKTNFCMNIPTNSVPRRTKRNIENVPFQTHALTKRLRVFDNKDVYLAENNGQRIKWGTSLWMMIFAAVTLHT